MIVRTLALTYILIALGNLAIGQKASIDTLDFSAEYNLSRGNSNSMIFRFPIVRTGRTGIDSTINSDIKNRFTWNDFKGFPVKDALIKWAEQRIVEVDFAITYNKNDILSLNIRAEGCGAYCTTWTEYFNYSLVTGQWLETGDVVDTSGTFPDMVRNDYTNKHRRYLEELKEMFRKEPSEFDASMRLWILEQRDKCEADFSFSTLSLHDQHLEIVNTCQFPNAIKAFAPSINLTFDYVDIKEFMRIRL